MVGINLPCNPPPPLPSPPPPATTMQMSVNFTSLRSYIFISFQQITFRVDNFTIEFNCWRIFPNWSQSKVEKTIPFMEGSICKFWFPIMRKNCQIESDVCICCKRDSKPLLWLSTQEQKKKSEKKKSWQISKGKQEQSSFDFFCVPFY